jgi:DNA-binding NtrC family response regulator
MMSHKPSSSEHSTLDTPHSLATVFVVDDNASLHESLAKLGIPRSTLDSKIKSLKINTHRFKTF